MVLCMSDQSGDCVTEIEIRTNRVRHDDMSNDNVNVDKQLTAVSPGQ